VTAEELPLIDEHSIEVRAAPDLVFDAVNRRFAHVLSGRLGMAFSRLWACDPPAAFAIVENTRPTRVVVAGKHRFAAYAIVFRITPTADGSRLTAESRAEFPHRHGRLYRMAVVGTRGHVVATRGLLRTIAKSATTTPAI
jgi:hypothetical protein